MSLARIRHFYGVPAYQGRRVRYVAYDTPREGTIPEDALQARTSSRRR